jgi:DNA topoisomerase I
MSYSLCIVESPAKCGKIQGFLGPGWKVVATMGHIRALEESVEAVGIDRDFQPRYTFIKEKGKAMSGIKEAAKSAHTIFLAADDDREGEAIAYSVAVLLNLDPAKTPRAVFHEITKEAVTKAVASPRRLDMNRVDAQQARAVLDMMVGFTISPILWKCVGPALSAGRCQTPALRLLVDREREITTFSAQTSWRISGDWIATAGGNTASSVTAGGNTFPASLYDELEDEESAMNFLENIHADTRGEVLSTKTAPRTAAPPKPLITSTLQQEASAIFSYQPKSTMKSAQKLYEQGHITYMRTDSTYISEEATAEAQEYVKTTFGAEYVGKGQAPVKKGKQSTTTVAAQEAHEAIRPTHMDVVDLTGDWTPADIRIYKLIWQRTIQSVMAPAQSEEHTVLFKAIADPGEFIWQALWKRSVFAGWKKVGLAAVDLDNEDETSEADSAASAWAAATKLKTGDALAWKSLSAHPHVTKPTGRYTEATLVRELERRGIGRPSTFASLVGTVLDKEYAKKEDKPATEVNFTSYHVEKVRQWPPTRQIEKKKVGAEKQKLSPTPLGTSVHDFCIREFPQLFDYGFTKKMEDRLDLIATGAEQWKGVCRDTWASYKDKLEDLKKNGTRAPKPKYEKDPEETVGELDDTPIIKKKGPFGFYFQWGTTRIPCVEGETLEAVQAKLKTKSESLIHTLGPYEFRRGPYGIYMMMKPTTKAKSKTKPVFVSIPQGLDPKILTEEAAATIYKNAVLEKKKKYN